MRTDRNEVGRQIDPPRGVGTPSVLSLSQIACNVMPRLRIDLIRRANLGEIDWGLLAARAATSVYRYGETVDLRSLPDKGLEETTDEERQLVAGVIGTMTSWPWVGASLATKTLHKKRPALIPILDNQAIFGAYMNPRWPEQHSLMDTIKAVPRIKEALDWIAVDITRPQNAGTWPELHAIEPDRSRIEIFDMVWWIHFRDVEPVGPTAPAAGAS